MAKTFSYNPTYNRLTAKGGTEGDPITFADLYQADQDNGWGVVHYYGQDTYHLDCLLYLGDGTTPTYFIDSKKLIVFTDVIGGNSTRIIYLYNNAHIQLGELVDEEKKDVCNGCTILSRYSGDYSYMFDGQSTNTYRRLYGCTFISPNEYSKQLKICLYGDGRLWHCNLVNYVWPNILGDDDIYRCTLTGGTDPAYKTTGLEGQKGSPSIDDYVATNVRIAARGMVYSQDLKISRMRATNEYAFVFDTQNYDAILVDCEFTTWIIYMRGVNETGAALRKYTVNINIADKNGAVLSGANIVCKDKDNNEVFSVNTDVNGDIEEQEVLYQKWYQLSGGLHGEEDATCYSPHKFIISKTGYETLEIDDITLSEPIKWHLELQDEIVTGAFLVGNNLEAMLEKDTNLSAQLEKRTNMIGIMREVEEAEGG